MQITPLLAPRLLEGRLALVTGAGQGIGRAVARGLAQAGAQVIVTDLNGETVEGTAADIRAAGGTAWAYVLDVASESGCADLARATGAIGKIDILVNNAGIIIREGFDSERAVANTQHTMAVNLQGSVNVTHAWLQDLKATRGTIINVASISSYVGVGGAAYAASKGAVKLLTQALAVELAKDGIRVNAVAPGVIETPISAHTREVPERLASAMQRTPMRRIGQPEELIGPVVFLASPMSSYVTGAILPVDGGFLAS